MNHTLSDKEKAFIENAVNNYYDEIYRFLVKRCEDEEKAKDISQETFVKFASSVAIYKERNKLRAYLYKIAINCSADYYRNLHSDLPLDEAIGVPAENILSPQTQLEQLETSEKVKNCLASLPQNYQDVLILRFYSDLKPREIAKVLNIPLATVKTRLYRAKEIFEREWKNEE